MIETFGCTAATASATVSKTGAPATDLPAPPGVTPPTTGVPYSTICVVWNEPSLPVIPCTRTRDAELTRMLNTHPCPTGGTVLQAACATASTTSRAASSIESTATMPASARIFCPSVALVPESRTTIGTVTDT